MTLGSALHKPQSPALSGVCACATAYARDAKSVRNAPRMHERARRALRCFCSSFDLRVWCENALISPVERNPGPKPPEKAAPFRLQRDVPFLGMQQRTRHHRHVGCTKLLRSSFQCRMPVLELLDRASVGNSVATTGPAHTRQLRPLP
jgi:hypothetical protein